MGERVGVAMFLWEGNRPDLQLSIDGWYAEMLGEYPFVIKQGGIHSYISCKAMLNTDVIMLCSV